MSASGVLEGVRILDLTHVWAGPLAVRMLADLGADVVRVEAPFGRGPKEFPYAPLGGHLGGVAGDDPWNTNAIFVKLMRNRRSICLDLKEAAGRSLFLALVEHADVVVENFSAGAMDRLELGYGVMRAVNPEIIHVSMPGFGNSGQLASRVAFGPTVEAMSGLTDVLGYSAAEPRNTAIALMDPICGTHAFAAVGQALLKRRETGVGCRVEMSLHEGGVNYSGPWLLDRQLGHEVQTWGNRHPTMVPHGVFRCAGDDEWLAIACASQDQWRALLDVLASYAIDVPATWHKDLDLTARRAIEDEIESVLERLANGLDKHELVEMLQQGGISAGAVNTTPDMVADLQSKARGFFVDYERHATPMPGNAIKGLGVDSSTWQKCPTLGEHNAEVLADWLNYDEQQIATVHSEQILHQEPPG